MIMIIIPSAATVATTEVDEVGNLLLLCSMLSRMAVLATIPRKNPVEDGLDDSAACCQVLFFSSAGAKRRRGRRGERKEGGRERSRER
jgi:hypothetical protein